MSEQDNADDNGIDYEEKIEFTTEDSNVDVTVKLTGVQALVYVNEDNVTVDHRPATFEKIEGKHCLTVKGEINGSYEGINITTPQTTYNKIKRRHKQQREEFQQRINSDPDPTVEFNVTEEEIEEAKEEAKENNTDVIISSKNVRTPDLNESDLGQKQLYTDSDGNIETRTIGYY
ncbi:hypothetical protein [Halorubrum distributum]|uniref:hypothetical protein n=1 Tax=Halorubrum distributum TaxID=29283 RepID=UPI0012680F54|nr:hypothetical protein [Halorubrum arcis]